MNTCAWCTFAQLCDDTEDLYHCVPKDMFRLGDEEACTVFADEDNGLIVNAPFTI
jgi:hypothetical protein